MCGPVFQLHEPVVEPNRLIGEPPFEDSRLLVLTVLHPVELALQRIERDLEVLVQLQLLLLSTEYQPNGGDPIFDRHEQQTEKDTDDEQSDRKTKNCEEPFHGINLSLP